MQEKQEMNIKKLSSAKIIVIALLIVSVIIFGSLSWFTMSKEVEGSGTQMASTNNGFELEVDGNGTIGFSALCNYLESEISGNSGTRFTTPDSINLYAVQMKQH